MTDRARWAEQRLEYRFTDPQLLEQALTHRSAGKQNNERLEFLGDALLNLAIARELFRLRADDKEGDLSRARATLVNKTSLAELGRELGLAEHLILGRGELRTGGAERSSILADAVEALFAAVFLDGGREAAERLILRLMAKKLERLPDAGVLKDAKTRLQETLQGAGLDLPEYEVESVDGSEHRKTFTVICRVPQKRLDTRGKGTSRRLGEQAAAAEMLTALTDAGI